MRLREAVLFAIRHDAELTRRDRSDNLRINGMRFVGTYRSKYSGQAEIKLGLTDVLSEDWILMKNGNEFVPDDYRA